MSSVTKDGEVAFLTWMHNNLGGDVESNHQLVLANIILKLKNHEIDPF